MPHEGLIGFFVFLMGVFTVGGAVFEWDFYWRSDKAQFLERFVGRLGARLFYLVVGLLLSAAGIAMWMGY